MSALDDTLDELGFAHKPGSTKGRMYSSRFYHAELKRTIRSLVPPDVSLKPVAYPCRECFYDQADFERGYNAALQQVREALG